MSIDEAGPLCARASLFYYRMSRLIPPIDKPRTSPATIAGLLAALLCAGCVGPFHAKSCDSCSQVVEEGAACEVSRERNCIEQPCGHEDITWRIGRKCLHVICLPCRICRGTLNFCAHNEAVGPPDIQAPGRFHPVPTHPVFAPVPEPAAYPEQH
jgi:hypothetical protein